MKTKGYSLWLMPSGSTYNKLKQLISKLSKRNDGPNFLPHVTLIGGILCSQEEILSKSAQLASRIQQYKIELENVGYSHEYFRCLFLMVRETDKVMNANKEAKKLFANQDEIKYKPHLSLFYGDLSPDTKEKIIKELGNKIKCDFDVNSIHLFSTNGEPNEWRHLKEFLFPSLHKKIIYEQSE